MDTHPHSPTFSPRNLPMVTAPPKIKDMMYPLLVVLIYYLFLVIITPQATNKNNTSLIVPQHNQPMVPQ